MTAQAVSCFIRSPLYTDFTRSIDFICLCHILFHLVCLSSLSLYLTYPAVVAWLVECLLHKKCRIWLEIITSQLLLLLLSTSLIDLLPELIGFNSLCRVFKCGFFEDPSANLRLIIFYQILVLRLVNIKQLTAQCWPSLLWGWYNKNLQVMVL